jgi:hypothetical protein
MPKPSRIALLSVVALALMGMRPEASITILRDDAVPDYPESVEFHLAAASSAQINWVELSFGTDALSCGEGTTLAYPEDFEPSTNVDVEWTWNLRQAGSLPPGTTVTWHWTVRDAAGDEVVTADQSLTFTNADIAWFEASSDSLHLLWIEGDQVFADSLLAAGEAALADLREMTGVELADRADVYVFPSAAEMQANTLFAPDWSGGLAFPNHRTVLLAIEPGSLAWGREVIAHELAHVVIGAYTFSCLDSTPPWLSEGLAMNAEGRTEPFAANVLQQAIAGDSLLSVRSLGQMFSADPDLAYLAYAQSESLVRFLIQVHGQEKMLQLLDEFSGGSSEDRALRQVYGFDRDGLEAEWRAWVGAPPMEGVVEPGEEPTRTPYPTFVPITGPIAGATPTPTLVAEATPSEGAPRTAVLVAGVAFGAACLFAFALAVGIVLIARRRAPGGPSGGRG